MSSFDRLAGHAVIMFLTMLVAYLINRSSQDTPILHPLPEDDRPSPKPGIFSSRRHGWVALFWARYTLANVHVDTIFA